MYLFIYLVLQHAMKKETTDVQPIRIIKRLRCGKIRRYLKFSCNFCSYVSFHKGHYQDHMNAHIKKQFCCKICRRKYTRKRDAVRHLKSVHNIEDCEENFNSHFCVLY